VTNFVVNHILSILEECGLAIEVDQ
jgi:hypothetical protein